MFRYHMQLATPSPSLPSPPRTTSRFAQVTVKVYLADRGFVFYCLPAWQAQSDVAKKSPEGHMRGIIPSTLFTLFYFTSHSLRAKQFILLTTGMDWGCADWIFNSLRLNLCFHRLIILGWFSLRLWWHTKLIYSMWQLMNSMPQQINIRRWTTRNRLLQMLS